MRRALMGTMHGGRGVAALALLLGVMMLATSAASAGAATPIEGTWRTSGYGQVLTIAKVGTGPARRITQYDLTSISCLKNATLDEVSDTGGVVTFAEDGVQELTLRVSGTQLVMRSLGAATDVTLTKVTTPTGCPTSVPSDAAQRRLKTFDIFWKTFEEQYPPYAARPLDYGERARDRAELVATNTEAKLSTVLRRAVTNLGDMHTGVSKNDDDTYGKRPGTRDSVDIDVTPFQPAIEARLGVTLRNALGKQVQYATVPGQLGYLRIIQEDDFAGTDGSFPQDQAAFAKALDTVFQQGAREGWRGLILDLRYNDGGWDGVSLDLAARLTRTAHFAFRKRARDLGAADGFTPFQDVSVTPSTRPGFTGPLALLVSDLTVSAGETASLTLLNRTPAPQVFGRRTQGVFSDQLSRTLPGGWSLDLSNEDYRTAAGTSYEGLGIPVPAANVTPVFESDELTRKCDSAIARALDALQGRPPGTTPPCP